MVMLYHAFSYQMGSESWSGLPKLVAQATKFGWLGVDLFFVLSGFLITGILCDAKSDPHYFRNFYARRALRILPLYYVVLVIILAASQDSGGFVLLSALYLANLVALFGVPMVYGPLWSLAVEEHFYLIWPLVVRFTTRRALTCISIAFCIGEPLIRAVGFMQGSDTYYYSWFRFDGLAWGALLALLLRHQPASQLSLKRFAAMSGILGGIIFVAGAPFGIMTRQQIVGASLQFTAAQLVFAGFLAAVLATSGTSLAAWLNWRPLRKCGDVSYCLYLIHLMLLQAWDAMIASTGVEVESKLGRFGAVVLRAVTALSAALVLATLSSRYLEQPFLRLKRYFRPQAIPQIGR